MFLSMVFVQNRFLAIAGVIFSFLGFRVLLPFFATA